MKTLRAWIVCSLFLLGAAGALFAEENTPPLKLQAYQGHQFEASKEDAFNATFTVLQDLGCTITSADIKTGYISAGSPRSTSGNHRRLDFSHLRVTAFVLSTGRNRCRVRLSAVRVSDNIFFSAVLGFSSDEAVVTDIHLYEIFFARVLDTLATQRQVWGIGSPRSGQ